MPWHQYAHLRETDTERAVWPISLEGAGVLTVVSGGGNGGDDERLLARAEEVLTEIKVSTGLSERHAALLAALRIRLKGDPGSSLEDLLAAAEDPQASELANLLDRPTAKPSTTFDDLLSKPQKPKRSLDDLLGSSKEEPVVGPTPESEESR